MDEIEILRELLETYSPSNGEGEAVRLFVKAASELGFSTAIDEAGNGIARRGGGRPQTMFLGHIDTVEGKLPVFIEDGRIHGRGACDAKGPLVAALSAASRHRAKGEIVVVAAVGEEHDSRGARFLLDRHRPDFVIVGEPSGWAGVTVAYKGNLDVVMTFRGERTHLSSPQATATETAMDFAHALREHCASHRGQTQFSSITTRFHSINTAVIDGVETVEVGMNIRIPPGIRCNEVLKVLWNLAAGAECRIIDNSEAVEVDRGNDVVRSLCAGIRAEGSRPTILRKGGSSDMNLVVPAWGCPAAAYGPGDSHLDHTNKESLDLFEWEKSVHVLEMVFNNLATRFSLDQTDRKQTDHSTECPAPETMPHLV